jgi:hypothetical protein
VKRPRSANLACPQINSIPEIVDHREKVIEEFILLRGGLGSSSSRLQTGIQEKWELAQRESLQN